MSVFEIKGAPCTWCAYFGAHVLGPVHPAGACFYHISNMMKAVHTAGALNKSLISNTVLSTILVPALAAVRG